ncbi:hypothetical protein, variant [Aphanomyces invadans]|uniref:FH2 domain-containing protein n=1 Tax=Aphanomyces invadans TaxID=157072 RepID=A0A024TRA7_9STRA|nr:hypothetical protein, variant [Aphanomyces invadans]ETV96553.1 hypothetical protein, variant [Aphanomyces invadans]|eukprot:XP_008874816.1 hypothetical protein, variant [Aphanomyces invadans]
MNYLSLRRSNSISSANEAGVNPSLRSIYSNTNSGQRALVFTVQVPERGPLGLDLRARNVTSAQGQTGAIVKGFRPVKGGKRGFIELTGRVKEKDILMQMHTSKVDDMLFDAIVELAGSLQSDLSAWPLRLEFRREPEEVEVKPKTQSFTRFLRSTSMSLAGFSTPAPAPSNAAVPASAPIVAAQDGTFQDKLNYFRGFFKDRLPTSTDAKRAKLAIPPLPSEDLVNEMYRDLLVKRNVPDDVLDELVRIEQLDQKWQIVWSAKQNENNDNHVYIADAIKLAEALVELNWDNRGLQVLETLQRKIAAGTPEWTDQFIVSYGLDYLAMKMPEPSPYSIEHFYKNFDRASRFCEVMLKILLSLSHFASGIDAITQTLGLVDRLALCFHTDNADVKRTTLQVLGIICYNSAEGHAAVVHSFGNYQEVKGERVRFTCLRDALRSTRYNLLFKEDVLSFINILVNKGLRVESRVAIRQDFMTLGIGEYFEEIRTKSNNMYKQAAKVKKKNAKTKPAKSPSQPTPKSSTSTAPSLPVPPLALTRSNSTISDYTTPHHDAHGTAQVNTIKEGSASAPDVHPVEPLIVLPDIPKPTGNAKTSFDVPEPLLVFDAAPVAQASSGAACPNKSPLVDGAFLSSFPRPSLPPLDVIHDEDDDDMHDEDVCSVDDDDESPIQLQIREQLDNVEKQIEVFELFMADDRKDTLYGSTDLSSMESVMRSLMERVNVDEFLRDCLLSILQQLLFIPSETVLGKEMWAMAERVTKDIALLSPVEEVRQYELSFQDRKKLMQARDKFSAFLAEHEPADLHVMHIGHPIALMENRINNSDDLLSDTDMDTDSTSEEDNQSELEDDEISQRLDAFRKLRKMGMPVEQLQLKMQLENLDIAWLDKYKLKKSTKQAQVMVKDHDDYQKYCKLLSMGMPLAHVQMKVGAENPALDGNLLATPEKMIPLDGAEEEMEAAAPAGVRADECPALAKFFKLKKMGMPPPQIQMKMQAEGFNGDLLLAPETLVDDDGQKVVMLAPVDEAAPPGIRADASPALTKFFKLKKMGMPQPQIELKMQAEGFDSDLLSAPETIVDEDGKKVVLPAPVPAGIRADACPSLVKFYKLQKMGMPPPQIQLKMEAEGFDPSLLLAPETLVDDDGKKFIAPSAGVRADACAALAKFFKLKKMGMPAAQIQLKMQSEGFDPALIDAPDTIVNDDGKVPKAPSDMVAAKDHPTYAKYFKLMKMGMPMVQIQLKVSSEGLDPAILDTPDALLPEDLSNQADASKKDAAPKMVRVADHPSYAKYFKLQKMGMPPPQIQLKMKAEGLDSDLLDSPDKEIPEVAEPAGPVLVKDHPEYSKYLKLQKMGMPPPQLELKMNAEGLDFALLATPDAEVPGKATPVTKDETKPSIGGAVNALKFVAKMKAKPKLRNLYWEPVHAVVKETSLWANLDITSEGENTESKHLHDLVTLFASAPPPTKEKSAKKPTMKKKAATRVGLIEVKRANNIGIMLARFRLPYAEIKRAILEIDRDILSSEKVAALIQFAPEGDELDTVKAYTGDPKLLGDAEQYFAEIAGIPRFQTRLQSLLATMQFDSNVDEQRRLITSVVSTCKDLKNNEAIPQILKIVLQLGNALNEGTTRGAFGAARDRS